MSLNEKDITLIEKYIDGDLSNEERLIVNERLKDTAFLEEVKLQKAVAESIASHYEQELREEFKVEVAELKPAEQNAGINPRQYLAWAAGISVVVAVSLFFFLRKSNNDANTLFQAYYRPFPATATTRGEPDSQDLISPAVEMYRTGNYKDALVLLQDLLKSNNDNDPAFIHLLLANCYLNLDQPVDALNEIQKVEGSGDEVLTQHAKWYYSLALLKQDRVEAALESLTEIESSNSMYANSAMRLKKEIKENDPE